MRKRRVIILHNIMAPYRFPLFSKIAKNKNIDLEVWFLSESSENRRWKINSTIKLPFKYRVLPKIEVNFFGKDLFTWILNSTFPLLLLKSRYDLIISAGWLDFACQAAFFISKLLRKPYIIWSESTTNEPSWRRAVTLPLVRLIVGQSDACLAIGTKSKEYLLELGADPKKVFVATSTVDIDHFSRTSKLLPTEKSLLRKKMGVATEKLILFVGQLIERKGLKSLISAFAMLKKERPDVGLMILGYGPQKQELVNLCRTQRIKNVYFVDHVEIDTIPKMYGLADLFVLPSTEETWGLVVNEAMACGLPIITTDKVGASVDLVKNGRNGFVVKPQNDYQLYKTMKRIIANPLLSAKMGKQSQKTIQNYKPKNAARMFLKAINYACCAN